MKQSDTGIYFELSQKGVASVDLQKGILTAQKCHHPCCHGCISVASDSGVGV